MSEVLYNKDGLLIVTGNPFGHNRITNPLTIVVYRTSKFGFKAHVPVNKFGTDAVNKAFKSIGMDVGFDSKRQEYVVRDEKSRFMLMLKFGYTEE